MSPKLAAIAGPLAGQTFPLGPQALTIGRDRTSGVQLRDPAVSRQHCVVEPMGGRFRLRDLGSRHGTFVNGLPVRQRILEEGDRITVGDSAFLFQQEEEQPDASSASLRAALLEIGPALQGIRATEPLARRFLKLVLEILPAERAALLLFDCAGEIESAFALDRAGSAKPFTVSRTLVQRILASRSAILSNDVLHGAGWETIEGLPVTPIRSLIAVPLSSPEGPLGVLYLDTREEGRAFRRDAPGAGHGGMRDGSGRPRGDPRN